MALDGLKLDGAGGVVDVDKIAESFGMSCASLETLEAEVADFRNSDHAVHAQNSELRFKIANILVTHLNHEERMCALHMFYDAETAPCSGDKLCRLKRKVQRKLRKLPEDELKSLWHHLL